jgi:hypothetical protein
MAATAKIEKLELLVDELVKEAPEEQKIRGYMKSAGLTYVEDPVERMNRVFAALERLRSLRRSKVEDRTKEF